jgi:hypothetical protein
LEETVNKLLKQMVAGLGLAALMLASALPVAAADDAMVRVLHASPDAPAVDVYVNDEIVESLTNVPFGAISDYLPLPAGDYNIKVYATGDNTTAVIDADVSVDAGMKYTVAAIGALAAIEPAVFADNPSVDESQALVRVIHLSPDAPAVDVAPDGADAVVSNLEFPDATDYLALPPDTYDLEVRLAGTDTVALQLDPLELEAGTASTVFAIGSAADPALGGNALSALVVLDDRALPDTAAAPEAVTNWAAVAALILASVALIVLGVGSRLAFSRR